MIEHFHSGTIDYDIVIRRGALGCIGNRLNVDRNIMVVTDDGIPADYIRRLIAQCPHSRLFTFPQGEKNKNIDNFKAILEKLLEYGFTRKDAVIALGGGVTGDMAGFAASCYMRGIDFYNIPTTLLAQVDSSVGGKTGIDFGGIKNSVGTFHHPKAVIIDPDTLETLDRRLLHEGLAEAIKMASTSDSGLFELIESTDDLRGNIDTIIARAVNIKKKVVEEDPDEKGIRKLLNFGHTIGHAIESLSGGELLHGECVAIGMIYMSDGEARERIRRVLKKYGLPTTCNMDTDALLSLIRHDKKREESTVTTVHVEKIGSYSFRKMTLHELGNCLKNNEL